MRFRVLGSGSSGNATLVECEGTRILVDAGLGPRELAERLLSAGIDPASIHAIVLSHEHGDHVKGAASFSRKWGVRIVATRGTYAAAGLGMAEIAGYDALTPFQPVQVGPLAITGIPVPHDAEEPVAFVIRGAGCRLGHATDFGHVDRTLADAFRLCDAVLVESNYDPTLLANGPYPWSLKERIFGARGHLSNADVARYLAQELGDACRQVVLAHLSEKNNHPELVQASASAALTRRGRGAVRVDLTGREGTDWIEVPAGTPPLPPMLPQAFRARAASSFVSSDMERRLIIGLAAALGVALLAIAFLLGRRSGEHAAVPPPVASGTAATTLTAEPPALALSTAAPPPVTGESPAVGAPAPSVAAAATRAGPGPALVASGDLSMRPEVVRYFEEVDAIQAEAKNATGDPEAMAQLIMKHATDGDMTEFDALLRSNRGLLDRLRAVTPPAPCAEHLRKSVTAVEDGIVILQQTRDAIASHDVANLTSLTATGQDLERRAREVDAMGAALKKRFGL